jgi:hypothetical protein
VVHTSRDVGGEHFCDLVEFPPLKESDEEDFGEQIAVTAEARDALDAAHAGIGVAIDQWVNQGMAQMSTSTTCVRPIQETRRCTARSASTEPGKRVVQ